MKRILLLSLVLAACSGKPPVSPAPAQTTTGPTAASDTSVSPGNGWTRTAPGQWQYAVDQDRPSGVSLVADPGGRGLERIALPAGASGAVLTAIDVGYTAAGSATWKVYPDQGGMPAASPVANVDVQITADMVGQDGAPPLWTHHALTPPAAVGSVFWLAFESPDGHTAVGAVNAPDAIVMYQAPGASTPATAPYTPFVRVSLGEVH